MHCTVAGTAAGTAAGTSQHSSRNSSRRSTTASTERQQTQHSSRHITAAGTAVGAARQKAQHGSGHSTAAGTSQHSSRNSSRHSSASRHTGTEPSCTCRLRNPSPPCPWRHWLEHLCQRPHKSERLRPHRAAPRHRNPFRRSALCLASAQARGPQATPAHRGPLSERPGGEGWELRGWAAPVPLPGPAPAEAVHWRRHRAASVEPLQYAPHVCGTRRQRERGSMRWTCVMRVCTSHERCEYVLESRYLTTVSSLPRQVATVCNSRCVRMHHERYEYCS